MYINTLSGMPAVLQPEFVFTTYQPSVGRIVLRELSGYSPHGDKLVPDGCPGLPV